MTNAIAFAALLSLNASCQQSEIKDVGVAKPTINSEKNVSDDANAPWNGKSDLNSTYWIVK
jgi:hypothetical protein